MQFMLFLCIQPNKSTKWQNHYIHDSHWLFLSVYNIVSVCAYVWVHSRFIFCCRLHFMLPHQTGFQCNKWNIHKKLKSKEIWREKKANCKEKKISVWSHRELVTSQQVYETVKISKAHTTHKYDDKIVIFSALTHSKTTQCNIIMSGIKMCVHLH